MENINKFDIIVVGASFAGHTFVRNIIKNTDFKVLLIERKQKIGQTVETTGLITEHTRALFQTFFDPDPYITNKITSICVMDTDFEDYFESKENNPWIYQTDTRAFVGALGEYNNKNVKVWTGASYLENSSPGQDGIMTVKIKTNGEIREISTKLLIGADGGSSTVARANGLDQTKRFLVGIEELYFGEINLGANPDSTIYHFWFGELSLGYGGWLSATVIDGKKAFRIGLAKNIKDAKEAAKLLKKFTDKLLEKNIISLEGDKKPFGGYGGQIPVSGVLKKTYGPGVLLIGDAAGYCGAFAADGIKGAVISGIEGAKLAQNFLKNKARNYKVFSKIRTEMNKHNKIITYYKKQVFYRFIWDRMKSDRTFSLMFKIVKARREVFLQQFCDSKDRNSSLITMVLTPGNLPNLLKYAMYLFLDIFKRID